MDVSGQKMALGFLQDSSENHKIGKALFRDLKCCGPALARQIPFVTDGGNRLTKALPERVGKKLLQRPCAIHKNQNLQHLAEP